MAREVNNVLAQIIAEQRSIPESKAEEVVKSMRSANQYQVCDFFLLPPPMDTRTSFSTMQHTHCAKIQRKSESPRTSLTAHAGGCLVIERKQASKQPNKHTRHSP
jgi:hypothetical protein